MNPFVMFGLAMLLCLIVGRLCAPLIKRWDLGPLCEIAWWIVSTLAGLACLTLFFGNPAGIPFILLWLVCAAFGLGVILYGFGSDMDDPDKY